MRPASIWAHGFTWWPVAPGRDAEPVRTFQSFTQDLHRLADWLKTVEITTVVMESTGVY